MTSSQIPHLMYADEVEADRMIAFRERFKPTAIQRGIKLTYMPIMIKAASLALLDFPLVNSSINTDLSEVSSPPCIRAPVRSAAGDCA